MSSIEARVKKVIAEDRDLEVGEVGVAATLKKDLGFDKMEVEFMLWKVEDEFAIELDEKAASKARSVQDVIDYVKKGLEAKIKSVIAECAGVSESSVTGRKTMKALEVEPDEVADLVTNLAVEFCIHIPLEEAQSIGTVQQAIDAVISRLESGSSELALEDSLERLEQLINEPLISNRIDDLESLSTQIEQVRDRGPDAVPRQMISDLLQRIPLYESWAKAYASESPAYAAAREGDATKAIQFVDAGLDVNAPGSDGRTLLMLAAANGHADAVERLIARGADCAAACELEGGLDAMYMACRNAHLDVVRALLDHGADVNKRYPNTDTHAWHNQTALGLAAELGHLNLCRLLIERGADLEAVSYSGRTPLMWAMRGDGAVAELLLDAGAKPDPKAKATKGAKVFPGFMGEMLRQAYASSETTPLILAVEAGLPKVAHRLIEAKVALDATNHWGKTALHCACESNQAECASHLIRAGANLDASDKEGLTPLICAARNGSWETMQLLLEAGAAVNQPAHQGGTALRDVISRLLKEEGGPSQREAALNFARKLLEAGANPDVAYEDDGDNKLVDEAQEQGDDELVDLLNRHGARLSSSDSDEDEFESDVDADDSEGADSTDLPGFAAARAGDEGAVLREIESGLDINAKGSDGMSLLMLTAASGHAALSATLIARGADMFAPCEAHGGVDAMFMACSNGHAGVAKVLLDHGADKDKRYSTQSSGGDIGNQTLLCRAAHRGHLEVCRLLIDTGADMEVVSDPGYTALMWAMVNGGSQEAAELLLDCGANPDPQARPIEAYSSAATTPLILAVMNGFSRVATRLIDAGVEVDAQDGKGWTALKYACQSNQAELAGVLIRAGADLDLADQEGWTALIGAASRASWEAMQCLLDAGADVNCSADEGTTALREVVSRRLLRHSIVFLGRLTGKQLDEAQEEGYAKALEFAKKLLEAGADPDVSYEDDGDNKLVDEAQDQGDEELRQLLEEYGAKLRDRSEDVAREGSEDEAGEEGPMDLAGILSKMQQSIASLNSALSQVTGGDQSDGDRLVIAASHSNVERVSEILESGVDVNHLDGDGDTALGICVLKLCTEELEQQDVRDFFELIDLLLQHGAKVDVQGCRVAPLPMVARAGSLALTNAFLRAGADPHAVLTEIDQDAGKTAVEVAREGGHDEVVAALMAAQA